jgi:hypothetical protein
MELFVSAGKIWDTPLKSGGFLLFYVLSFEISASFALSSSSPKTGEVISSYLIDSPRMLPSFTVGPNGRFSIASSSLISIF